MRAHLVTALLAMALPISSIAALADSLDDEIIKAEQSYQNGNAKQSEISFDSILKRLEKSNSEADQKQLSRVLNNLAVIYNETGRNPKALECYKRALALREKLFGANTMEVATTLNNLGNLYKDQKRFTEAEPLYKRSMAIAGKLEGAESTYMAMSNFNMGSFYMNQNKFSLAADSYKKALEIGDKTLGPNNDHVMDIVVKLAEMYDKLGKTAQAKPLYTRYLNGAGPLFGISEKDPNRISKWKKVTADMRKDKNMTAMADQLEKAIAYQTKK